MAKKKQPPAKKKAPVLDDQAMGSFEALLRAHLPDVPVPNKKQRALAPSPALPPNTAPVVSPPTNASSPTNAPSPANAPDAPPRPSAITRAELMAQAFAAFDRTDVYEAKYEGRGFQTDVLVAEEVEVARVARSTRAVPSQAAATADLDDLELTFVASLGGGVQPIKPAPLRVPAPHRKRG